MTKKKKSRLGKGLGALLGDVKQTTSPASVTEQNIESVDAKVPAPLTSNREGSSSNTGLKDLPIECLQRGKYQPRVNMDKEGLEELADSIRSQGIIQPLLVRQLGPDQYEIIAGERRWRGAQLAGLSKVPAVVRDITDETAMAVGLIENIQRQDLNVIEEAMGFQRLLDEFGLTHEEVAEAVGRSRAAVSNTLRLLGLDQPVRTLVEQEQLSMGHARAILALEQQKQIGAARKVVTGGLSVRATEHMVKRMNRGIGNKPVIEPGNADTRHLENDLSEKIGAKVEIQHGAKKGKLIIHYHSLDELDGILGRIN